MFPILLWYHQELLLFSYVFSCLYSTGTKLVKTLEFNTIFIWMGTALSHLMVCKDAIEDVMMICIHINTLYKSKCLIWKSLLKSLSQSSYQLYYKLRLRRTKIKISPSIKINFLNKLTMRETQRKKFVP